MSDETTANETKETAVNEAARSMILNTVTAGAPTLGEAGARVRIGE
jgi:hypothetical protein